MPSQCNAHGPAAGLSDHPGEVGRPPGTGAAFFDLDNTLLHGASMFLLGRGLLSHGVVSRSDVLRGAWQEVMFRLVGERDGGVNWAQERGMTLGAGLEVPRLLLLGERIFDELIADRILAQTLALARAHLDQGEAAYIVTAAPVELARLVARRLGLTDALGTVSEVEEDRWTGRLVGDLLRGPAKAREVVRLASDCGHDLKASSAYSDSINDLPLLELVGHPHAVNPDRGLLTVARARGWPVHDFRMRRRRRPLVAGAVALIVALVVTFRRTVAGDRRVGRRRSQPFEGRPGGSQLQR